MTSKLPHRSSGGSVTRFDLAKAFLRYLDSGQAPNRLKIVTVVDRAREHYSEIPSIFAEPPKPHRERPEPIADEEPTIVAWGGVCRSEPGAASR